MVSADQLAVPAGYLIYFGTRSRRPDVACSDDDGLDCWRCERAGIGLLPGLVARQIASLSLSHHPEEVATDAYRHAVPMEDLGLIDSAQVVDLNLRALRTELRDFLLTEQWGARAVAKRLFRQVSEYRLGQFSAAQVESRPGSETDALFGEFPVDTGHFGVSYFEHVLRGLRRRPPAYVTSILRSVRPTALPRDLSGVAGVVVVEV